MATKVMQGVRILEVAQFTFVPAAGGILADYPGYRAEVEKYLKGVGGKGKDG